MEHCLPPQLAVESLLLGPERARTATSITADSARPSESLLRPQHKTTPATIAIVDDEPIIIKVLQKHLREAGYNNFISTSESRDALDLIRQHRPDVIMLDIMMPHITGLNILEVIRGDRSLHHTPVIILSASGDDEMKQCALELGATDFLTKPLKPSELVPRIRNALVIKAHHDHLEEYSKRLEYEVRLRTAELAQSRQEVIHVLAAAAECRDQETGNHVLRVGRYVGIIARQLNFSPARAELIEQAAILHDVGKIGVTDAILLKPGKLDAEEITAMRKHCEYGQRILQFTPSESHRTKSLQAKPRSGQSPILCVAATIAMSHHEKWDGTGYPRGLAGESIPIEGRITAVADVFDALGSRRPYKEPMPLARCFEILEEGRAKHFDPAILDAFFARKEDVVRVAEDLSDAHLTDEVSRPLA